jgi:hypothetical protein
MPARACPRGAPCLTSPPTSSTTATTSTSCADTSRTPRSTLVYLDPPFNSNRDYNVIFRDESGNATDAQLLAFEDTWHWGPSAEATYAYLTNTARHEGRVPNKVSTIIAALRSGIGENQMMAYLVEMADLIPSWATSQSAATNSGMTFSDSMRAKAIPASSACARAPMSMSYSTSR